MKMVILSAFYEPFMSGAEQMAKELAERLGTESEVILITARLRRGLSSMEYREHFKLERVGLGLPTIDKFLFPILAAWRVRRHRPKLVHAIMESYAGGALVLAGWFYPSAKRVLTLQSGDLDDPRKGSFWRRLVWGPIHRAPDHLTAISGFLAERAKRLGVPAAKISVIPNGVDLSSLPPPIIPKPMQVICVARLSWEKGLDYLIQAWPAVLAVISAANLLIIGEGPERQKLEKLIHSAHLHHSIKLLGRLPHDQVLHCLRESVVFVCPSLAEGLGIVFIEAQACGVPVIGTNVGGIPDVIDDQQTGLLVPPANSAALSEAIIKLLTDRVLSERLRQTALVQVGRYDWTNIVNRIKVVYQALCPQESWS